MTDRLEGLLEELGCLLGKMILWRVVSTYEEKTGLAEWTMGTRAAAHCCWLGFQGSY